MHGKSLYAADWIRTVEATQLATAKHDDKRRIEVYKFLGYVTFVCFSVESFFNFVGDFEFGEAWNERDSVDAKFDSIVKKLGLAMDLNKGSRPYQSIRLAFDCRDAVSPARNSRLTADWKKLAVYGAMLAKDVPWLTEQFDCRKRNSFRSLLHCHWLGGLELEEKIFDKGRPQWFALFSYPFLPFSDG